MASPRRFGRLMPARCGAAVARAAGLCRTELLNAQQRQRSSARRCVQRRCWLRVERRSSQAHLLPGPSRSSASTARCAVTARADHAGRRAENRGRRRAALLSALSSSQASPARRVTELIQTRALAEYGRAERRGAVRPEAQRDRELGAEKECAAQRPGQLNCALRGRCLCVLACIRGPARTAMRDPVLVSTT